MSALEILALSGEDQRHLAESSYEWKPMDPEVDSELARVIVRKPWGYEYLAFANRSVALWILHLTQGSSTSLHSHPAKDTELVLLQGEALVSTLGDSRRLMAGQGVRIEKGVFHQTQALSENCHILEIERPNNKHDLVRLRDAYGRAGGAYEGSEHFESHWSNFVLIDFRESGSGLIRRKIGSTGLFLFRGTRDEFRAESVLWNSAALVSPLKGFPSNVERIQSFVEFTALCEQIHAGEIFEAVVIQPDSQVTSVASAIADAIAANDARHVFMVETEQNVHLIDALVRAEGVAPIPFSDARSASLAALGATLMSNQRTWITVGGLLADLKTREALIEALKARVPLKVLVGLPQSHDEQPWGSVFRANKFPILEQNFSAGSRALSELLDVERVERTAFETYSGSDVAVRMQVPIEIQTRHVRINEQPVHEGRGSPQRKKGTSESDYDRILRSALSESRRPLILLGRGLQQSNVPSEHMSALGDLTVPVLTTRSGMGVVSEELPNYAGRGGAYGMRGANFSLQNADLILGVAASLSPALTGRNWRGFGREARLIMMNLDSEVMGRPAVEHSDRMVLEAEKALTMVLRILSSEDGGDSERLAWMNQCKRWRTAFDIEPVGTGSRSTRSSAYEIMSSLSPLLLDADVLGLDGGWVLHVATHALRICEPIPVLTASALEAQGVAVSLAVGAMAASENPLAALVICDEVGLAESMEALLFASERKLSLTVLVLNQSGSSATPPVKEISYPGAQQLKGLGYLSPKDLARGAGCEFLSISTRESSFGGLEDIRSMRRKATGPLVVEFCLEGFQELSPRPAFVTSEDGSWKALPIEDLAPLLPLEVLEREMLIELTEESIRARG